MARNSIVYISKWDSGRWGSEPIINAMGMKRMAHICDIYMVRLKMSGWSLHRCWDRRGIRHTHDALMYLDGKWRIFRHFRSHGSWKVENLHGILIGLQFMGSDLNAWLTISLWRHVALESGILCYWGWIFLTSRIQLVNDFKGISELGYSRIVPIIMTIDIAQSTWVVCAQRLNTHGWWLRRWEFHDKNGGIFFQIIRVVNLFKLWESRKIEGSVARDIAYDTWGYGLRCSVLGGHGLFRCVCASFIFGLAPLSTPFPICFDWGGACTGA